MAEDSKRNLQTQKGITDEIKAQKEELSKLNVGSAEYNAKLKEVIRLQNIKTTILSEQKTIQEKQNETQDKAKSLAKELNDLISARDKKLKSLRGQESFSVNLQKRSQKAQADFLKTLKTRVNKSGELVATSKEQKEVIEGINAGQNDISGLQRELEISKEREKGLRGKNLIYKEDEQTLQKILESEIKAAKFNKIKNAGLKTADNISGGMVSKAQEFGETMGISPKNLARLGVAGFIVGAMLKALTAFSAKIDEVGQTFGFLTNKSVDFRNDLIDSGNEAIAIGKGLGDVLAVTSQLSSEFGISLGEAKNLSNTVLDTAVATGLSNDEAGKLFGTFMQIGDLTAKQAENLIEGTAQLAAQEGVAPQAVLRDLAASSEEVAKFTKAGGENIAEAAVQARRLGLSIADTAKISEGLLDFQSSIEKEVEASVLIGKQLNFQKARELALNNDIAGATAEVVKQLGSEEEFNSLNVIQRKALADSIGVSVNEMAKLVSGTEKLTLKSALAGKNFDDLVGGDALSALTKIVNAFKSIAATLLDTFGGPVADFLEKFTGPDGLVNIKLQLVDLANIVIDTFNAGRDFLNTFRRDKELAKRLELDEQGNIVKSQVDTGDRTLDRMIQERTSQQNAANIRNNNPRDSVLASTTSPGGTTQSSLLTTGGGGNQNVNVNVAMKSTISGGDIRSIANREEITQDKGYVSLIGGSLS